MTTEDASHVGTLRVFCHRLGSAVGALVNNIAMLRMDAESGDLPANVLESLDGAGGATDDVRALLTIAREWVEAFERPAATAHTTREDLGRTLGVTLPDGPAIGVDAEVLGVIARQLSVDGRPATVEQADEALCVRWRTHAPVAYSCEELSACRHPFRASCEQPYWICARALARRAGVQVRFADAPCGHLDACLVLPASAGEEA